MADELDLKITKYLIDDAKLSIRDLAKLCNVSPGTVRNRLIVMEKNKEIIGYVTRFNGKKLGIDEAILGLDIMPEHYIDTLEKIKSIAFVKDLFSTSGDHSAIAVIFSGLEGKTINECISEIEKVDGVRTVYPSIVNNTIK